MKKLLFCALPALALASVLAFPEVSLAQRRGGGFGNGPGYGGIGIGSGGYGGSGFSIGQGGIGYGPNYGYGYGNGMGYGSGYGYGNGYGGWNNGYGGLNSGYGYGNSGLHYGANSGWGYAPSQGYYGGTYNNFTQGGTISGDINAGYQSSYPPGFGGQQQQMNDRAMIRVHVAPDARVSIDGSPTQQTGSDRLYVTPQLEGQGNYTYKVTARWRDQNGQEQTRTETVRFSAGRTVDVNLMAGQGGTGTARPMTGGSEELSEPNNPSDRRPQPQSNPANPNQSLPPANPANPNQVNPTNPNQSNPPASPANPGKNRPERQPD